MTRTPSKRLTEHISLGDLRQRAYEEWPEVPYPEHWVESRARPLAEVLEVLRAELGQSSLEISSGYRTLAFNEALRAGGHPVARVSRHCEGLAADVIFPSAAPIEAYLAALHLHGARKVRIGAVGLYSGWIHVDLRPGRMTSWIHSHGPVRAA